MGFNDSEARSSSKEVKRQEIDGDPYITVFASIQSIIRHYCIKAVPKAFNSRALTSEKPCINKAYHVPLTHRYLTFHMQDSGQYPINTEEASRLQLKLSIKQFT